MIDELIGTGYKVIIRPHPQTFVSEKDMIEPLMKAYPETDKLKWDRNIDNFDTLNQSDVLISDFSGVILDYALVFDRPVIFAETAFDNGIYDSWWLEEREWIFETLDKIGICLTSENMKNIKELVEQSLTDNRLKAERDKARAESWANMGKSVESIADYLVEKRKELNLEEK